MQLKIIKLPKKIFSFSFFKLLYTATKSINVFTNNFEKIENIFQDPEFLERIRIIKFLCVKEHLKDGS